MPRGPFPLTFPAAKALQTRGSCPGDAWGRAERLALLVEEMFSFGSNVRGGRVWFSFFFLERKRRGEGFFFLRIYLLHCTIGDF